MRLLPGLILAAVVAVATPALADPFVKGAPPTPGAGNTSSGPWSGRRADGEIFVDIGEGRIRHQATGFLCEREIAGFTRDSLAIYDRSEDGRDVSCRFRIADSWVTLYFTKLPGMDGGRVFDIFVMQAKNATTVVEEIPAPLAVGNPPLPGYARFWRSTDTTVNGLWLVQIGDWCVKLRATYEVEDEARIAEVARLVFESVHAQVAPPEI